MDKKSKLLILEVKDGRIEIYIGVPTRFFKILIAIITAVPAVAELLRRYPQVAAILTTVINGG
jgi:hypothetical protein